MLGLSLTVRTQMLIILVPLHPNRGGALTPEIALFAGSLSNAIERIRTLELDSTMGLAFV